MILALIMVMSLCACGEGTPDNGSVNETGSNQNVPTDNADADADANVEAIKAALTGTWVPSTSNKYEDGSNIITFNADGTIDMLGETYTWEVTSAKSAEKMFEIAMQVIEKGLSVRQVEALVKEKEEKPKKRPAELNWDVKNAIDFSAKKIQDRLGAKVNVSYSNKFKGKIEINFADYKEMNRLLDLLNK